MILDRKFDLIEEFILDGENYKCVCGSGAIDLGGDVSMVAEGNNIFTCTLECWDCKETWEIKVRIIRLVEKVEDDDA